MLCEKPLANTVAGCRRIVDAAQSAGRVLAVGFNLRYFPAMKFVREVLDAGEIGELDHLRLFGGHDGLHNFRADWQYRAPESGGGAMMDIGIHLSDLARYFLGEITDVYGFDVRAGPAGGRLGRQRHGHLPEPRRHRGDLPCHVDRVAGVRFWPSRPTAAMAWCAVPTPRCRTS